MKYDKDWLTQQFQKKERLKFLHFWGHQAAKDGSITQSCFSQWWPAAFETEGIRYPTAEHWMMAGKASLFNDKQILDRIMQAESPAETKKLGRLIQNFDPAKWDKQKYEIVVQGNYYKFRQNPALADFLLRSGERVLVEASPVDPVWGIGLAADDPRAENPLLWKGENLLGFALMEVRDRLKEEL